MSSFNIGIGTVSVCLSVFTSSISDTFMYECDLGKRVSS